MNRPSLLQYLGMAVLLALTALATEFILWRLSNVHDALRYTLLLTAMLYLGWLLLHSSQHTGRLILGTITLSILTGMLLWSDSLFVLIPVLTTAPWIIRTLLYYSGIAPSSIDLGLSLSSMAIATWIYAHTAGLPLAIWCFLLLQSLQALIPRKFGNKQGQCRESYLDPFNHAYQSAETALRQLTSGL